MFYEEDPVVKCLMKKNEDVYRDTIKNLAGRLKEAEYSIPQMEEILEERIEKIERLAQKIDKNDEVLYEKTVEVSTKKKELNAAMKKVRELELELEMEKKTSGAMEEFFESNAGTLNLEVQRFAGLVVSLKKENEQLAIQLKELNEDRSQLTKK